MKVYKLIVLVGNKELTEFEIKVLFIKLKLLISNF